MNRPEFIGNLLPLFIFIFFLIGFGPQPEASMLILFSTPPHFLQKLCR